MLEYIFFHEEPLRRFVAFLREEGLSPAAQTTDESRVVMLDEQSVDDAMADRIDDFYDDMFDLDQQLHDSNQHESVDNHSTAGVVVNLVDGRAVYADVPGNLLSKVMQVLTPRELGDLVNAIVDAVENPDDRPLCKRHPG